MSKLDEILAFKRKEVGFRKNGTPIAKLERNILFGRKPFSLKQSLLDPEKTGIIAEFKRKSPSKGIINDAVKVDKVTTAYSEAGASGLSVLTCFNFFGGADEDLVKARNNNNLPILRKEFIIDEYQVLESKSIGADAILLIASALSSKEVFKFSMLAKNVGMEVVLEVHSKADLHALNQNIDIVGVNNRDLRTFEVDIQNSIDLKEHIPGDVIKISESGISKPDDIQLLKKEGYNGFLIGENFMKEADPGKAFKDFVSNL